MEVAKLLLVVACTLAVTLAVPCECDARRFVYHIPRTAFITIPLLSRSHSGTKLTDPDDPRGAAKRYAACLHTYSIL